MNMNFDTLLTGCFWAALLLAILLPVLLPCCLAAAKAASTLYSFTWALRIVLRLWRMPSLRCAIRMAWRQCLIEAVGLYVLL